MKYLLSILLFISINVCADQRFETDGGYCHTAHNVNDADDEIYFSNCVSSIWTPKVDGQRVANGNTIMSKEYPIADGGFPVLGGTKFKGVDAPYNAYLDYDTAANTPCVMVTANYDAANDDQNETVYVTNDWNLSYEWLDYNAENQTAMLQATLSCRGGVQQ